MFSISGTDMDLSDDRRLIFLDCQTTGMRPPQGHILEMAWRREERLVSHLVRLDDAVEIPKRVQEITGLARSDLGNALPLADIFSDFLSFLENQPLLVIHYAQFERPFLVDLFRRFQGHQDLPLEILCVHRLTKRLFPGLPSGNLRATAGFFGPPVLGPNRAATFVQATAQIWHGLKLECERRGLHDLQSLRQLMAEKTKKSGGPRYEYRLDRLKRLDLPETPGVYRMLAKGGQILYVGKATSLRDRVNSYFRGRKGRDTKKLEMLAQVWDLRITSTRSPLEAALLETDEIKRHDPPYNVALKQGRRRLVFYTHDFSSSSPEQDEWHPVGPFRQQNWIEHLRLVAQSLKSPEFLQIFFDPIEPALLAEGFNLFLDQHGLDAERMASIRSMVSYGLHLFRHHQEPEDTGEEADETERSEDRDLTAEDLAGKFERLFRRAGASYWRARNLTVLLNSRITYQLNAEILHLAFLGGEWLLDGVEPKTHFTKFSPWRGLGIETFDRMSVLLSELQRYPHRIDRL
jgi:DNA polymerase-3 subunit epsilon